MRTTKIPSIKRFIFFSLALFIFVLAVGSSAFVISMKNIVDKNKNSDLLQMLELQQIKLENSVNSEIAIVLKLADSPLIKRYFEDPSNTEIRNLALEEINGYRRAFSSFSIFWINNIDMTFHSDENTPYVVDPKSPENYWYDQTLYETDVYNFNINYNPDLKTTKLWINAPVFDENNKPIGMVGTGIELTVYVDMLYNSIDDNVDFYLFNNDGEITGSKNTGYVVDKSQISDVLGDLNFDILKEAKNLKQDAPHIFDSSKRKFALGTIPVLEWYIIANAPISIDDYEPLLIILFLVMLIIIAFILILFNLYVADFLRAQKKTIDSLGAASKAKSDFLAKMSHEIRTPMNAIIGMAEIALRRDDVDTLRENIFTIKQAGTNLLSIINDILDFSKIEAGKLEIINDEYLLASLINDVTSIIRMRTVDSQILFVVNIDSNLPSTLYGDEIRIRQILLNLLSNAVKFTEQGHVSFTLTGEIDGDTVNLILSVSDSGKGIKEADMDKLFQDFLQFETTQNKNIVGTGLGLPITRSLTKAMGGELTVDSDYGKGSTFTVSLSQKICDPRPLAAIENPEKAGVLVYELREIYANSIVCTIDNLGAACTLAATDAELLQELKCNSYHYLFVASDLYESVRSLLETFDSTIRIILLAGFGEAVADKNLQILEMPASCISVANILNGTADSFIYHNGSETTIRFTTPQTNILIVDDINTNLMVAEGLLMPYQMQIKLCKSGCEAIEAVKKEKFDLIFMDHMMPDLDGIETTKRIRTLDDKDPYYQEVPIIALTANAISGVKEMFLAAGLNDFLSKPIDTIKLNAILEKWIPKEKQQKTTVEHDPLQGKAKKLPSAAINPKLLEAFCSDVKKAVKTLTESVANGNIKLFTTTAHAMKSALANIDEKEKSKLAYLLEQAGKSNDIDYINAHTDSFVALLEALMQNLSPAAEKHTAEKSTPMTIADKEFLKQQIKLIKSACEDYDDTTAYAALDRLKEKHWNTGISARLESIFNTLYLDSDFEEAGKQADVLLFGEEYK